MMTEEISHAKIFDDIRERAKSDESLEIETTIDIDELKRVVDRVNELLTKIKKMDIKDSEAYTYGATLEGDLNEAKFLERIYVSDKNIAKKIEFLKNSYNKHKIIIINYAKGIK